jgi:hypothetical protein
MNNSPNIQIGLVANLFSRMMHFKQKGDIEIGHTHQFDHLTLLASGSLQVTVDGTSTCFTAPCMIYIHKDKVHELVSLEDNTVAYCIHALRENNENNENNTILDPQSVPNGVSISDLFRSNRVDRILASEKPNRDNLERLENYNRISAVTYKDSND